MFEKVWDNVALSQKIVSQVTDAIVKGELKPGDRIAPERELATMFGVSRTAIRDAVKILSGRGVLQVRHGVGIFVSDAPSEVAGLMEFAGADLRELFEIRQTLETQAAGWAASRGADEQLDRLRKIVEDAWEHTNDLQVLAERDAQFHVAVAEASQNLVLVKVMWMLLDALQTSRHASLSIPKRPVDSLREHEQIVKAITAHDEAQARELMHEHLRSVEQSIKENAQTSHQ